MHCGKVSGSHRALEGWHQSGSLPAHLQWRLERRTRAQGQVPMYPEMSPESARYLSLYELDPKAKSKNGWPLSAVQVVPPVCLVCSLA